MAKYLAMQDNSNSSTVKAQVHMIIIPIIMAIILFILNRKLTIVGPIGYVVFVVAYFNMKTYIVGGYQTIQDKKEINSFALIILLSIIAIAVFFLLLVM